VERFMKLIQAISSIKTAIVENMYTYWILPFFSSSYCMFEYKCILVMGIRLQFKKLPAFIKSSWLILSIVLNCGEELA